MSTTWSRVAFGTFLRRNSRPYTLKETEDANLVGMRLYGLGPFHRELKPALRIAKKSHFVLKCGDVIYNKLFAWKGAFGLVPLEFEGMFVSDKFPTYELDRNQVDERFLYWYFHCPQLWEEAKAMSTGSAALSKLTLNPPKFLLLTMPRPTLQEQRWVAEKLDRLSGPIREAARLREKAAAESDELLFAGCELALRRAEQRFPSEPLGSLVDQTRGISYGVVQTGSNVEGGVPTLRAGDLRWFRVNTANIKRIARHLDDSYRRTKLQGREVLLRIRGGVGALAVAPDAMVGGNVSREIAVIPFQHNRIEPRFAMYLLAAHTNQTRLVRHVKGTSYVGINLRDVRSLPLPVPSPSEQRAIVERLDALQAKLATLERLQTETSAQLTALLPALLDRAFKGELLRR